MQPISVVIIDDHEIFRQGIRALLSREPGVNVVGEASDGRTAVKLVQSLRPDVVSMKVVIPELNGIDATRQIRADVPATRVLALAARLERKLVVGMLQAGAHGYLTRECNFAEYVRALHDVSAGNMYFCPAAAEVVIKDYLRLPRASSDALSPREREILQLIAEGGRTTQIARKLFISSKTVDSHRRSIMSKVGANSIAALTKYAIKEGLTTVD